jgi:hypothetical protein
MNLRIIYCLALAVAPVFAQQKAGEPVAGGGAENNVRLLLPPTNQTMPVWSEKDKQQGYVVYTDDYNRAIWPKQVPTREQITDHVTCRLSLTEYEPIQIGVFGVDNSNPLEQVKVTVDIDLPFDVRFIKYRDRTRVPSKLNTLGRHQCRTICGWAAHSN